MKIKLTISIKIWITFSVLIISIVICALITRVYLNNLRQLNRTIPEIYIPSIEYLTDLRSILHRCEDWQILTMSEDSLVFSDLSDKLERTKNIDFPPVNRNIIRISQKWPFRDQEIYLGLSAMISDSLFSLYEEIMNSRNGINVSDNSYLPVLTNTIHSTNAEIEEEVFNLLNKYSGLLDLTITKIEEENESFSSYLILMTIILSIISVIIALLVIRSMVRPVNQFKLILQEMARGKLPDRKIQERDDEIGQMAIALNSLAAGLKALSSFSEEIGKGNYDSRFKPLSDNDTLGNALLRMREDLKNVAIEDTKRKKEDEIRNWSNHGIARFSEILREHTDNISNLSEAVIGNLVKYVEAKIGALFLLNRDTDGKQYLVLTAAYAYDRKKHLKKEIQPGEGLAGRCLQEGETIYLTDVPEDYIKIKSGLGENKPASILIVPLKMHEEIFGVVELASFEEMASYKIEFVERIGSSIASTISAVKGGWKRRSVVRQKAGLEEGPEKKEEKGAEPDGKSDKKKTISAEKEAEIRKKLDKLTNKKK